MWWLTPAIMLTISIAIYTYYAAHVYAFSPLHTHREPAPETRVSQQSEHDRDVAWVKLRPGGALTILPFDVPVPADGVLTSGAVAKHPDRVELGVRSDLSRLLAFYRTQLAIGGWQEVRSWMARPVGEVSGPGTAFSIFCRAPEGPHLIVAIVHDPTANASHLQLRLSGEQPGPCNSATMPTPGDGDRPGNTPTPWDPSVTLRHER